MGHDPSSDDGAGRRRRAILTAIRATLAIEAITCALRFGLGMQSSRDTSALARWTLGLRIHVLVLGSKIPRLPGDHFSTSRCVSHPRRPSSEVR